MNSPESFPAHQRPDFASAPPRRYRRILKTVVALVAATGLALLGGLTPASASSVQFAGVPTGVGVAGQPYLFQFTAFGGVAPYSFALTSGIQPTGLTFTSAGHLSGTPTEPGSFSFGLTATDANGDSTASPLYVINIAPAPVTISGTPPAGIVGQPYSFSYTATDGVAPYNFAVTSGQLPSGVTLSSDGTLSGTPVTSESASFAVHVTDANGTTAEQASSINIDPQPVVISGTPPKGVRGVPYYFKFDVSGNGPVTVEVVGGTVGILGMSLSSDGVLSGTPQRAGETLFTLTATDSVGTVGNLDVFFQVDASLPVISGTLPDGVVGTAYSAQLNASGPEAATWAATGLPPGLSINSASGLISGTPITPGTFTVTVQATNFDGGANATFTVAITGLPPTLNTTPPQGVVGQAYVPYSFVVGGVPAPTVTVTGGNLPPGLTLSSAGVLSGTPTSYGSYTFNLTASNGIAPDATAQVTVKVNVPADGALKAPGKPYLLTTQWFPKVKDGNFTVAMTGLPFAQKGSLFRLYQDGVLVSEQNLDIHSWLPIQTAVVPIRGLGNGSYTFVGVLINSKGENASAPLTVNVTEALPAKPVLTSNAKGGGSYTVTAKASGGTNATSYTLYEQKVGSSLKTVVKTATLPAQTPLPQSVSVPISGKSKGSYLYTIDFTNQFGSTTSNPLTVTVK